LHRRPVVRIGRDGGVEGKRASTEEDAGEYQSPGRGSSHWDLLTVRKETAARPADAGMPGRRTGNGVEHVRGNLPARVAESNFLSTEPPKAAGFNFPSRALGNPKTAASRAVRRRGRAREARERRAALRPARDAPPIPDPRRPR